MGLTVRCNNARLWHKWLRVSTQIKSSSALFLFQIITQTWDIFLHHCLLIKSFLSEHVRNAGYPACLAGINVTFHRSQTWSRAGETTATKGSFSSSAFSPHWPKSPPSFTTPPLLLLLHLLLNAPLLLILQPGFMKGLSLLLVLKSNEIW